MRLLAISGSLRQGSYNTLLLETAMAAAPASVAIERLDGLREVPAYDEDLDRGAAPPAVRALRAAISSSDALLIATPEYNGSVPGHLKTAIDWASRPAGAGVLIGKPTAVIGASIGSFGGIRAQEELRKMLRIAAARVVANGVAVADAARAFDGSGHPRRSGVREQLQRLLVELIAEAVDERPLAA
jgi:chromate reductase